MKTIDVSDLVKKQDRGFLPSFFVAATLPFRKVEEKSFKRSYNGIQLTLVGDEIPYGKYARLLLSFITTNCVLNSKSGDLVVSVDSISDLCRILNVPKQRGKDVLEQLFYFSRSAMIYEGKADMGSSEQFVIQNIPFISGLRYLKEKKTVLMNSFNNNVKNIEFDIKPDFVHYASSHAVPVSFSVYSAIESSLGKDLYAWLCYRNNGLSKEIPLFLTREKLVEQFMPVNPKLSELNRKKMVSNNYLAIVENIKTIKEKYYRDLNVKVSDDNSGVYFYKSVLQIPASKDESFAIAADNLGVNFEGV